MMDELLPVVQCRQVGRGQQRRWRFWCGHCKSWHTHSPEPGHRVAHCHSAAGRRAYPQGYVLELHDVAAYAAKGEEQ
jgi:hypothetical protein